MIRLATPGDGSRLAEIYAPAVAASGISFELEAPDVAESPHPRIPARCA